MATRAEIEELYRQWLASNPQIQSEEYGPTGDNESFMPGGTRQFVDINGRKVYLDGNGTILPFQPAGDYVYGDQSIYSTPVVNVENGQFTPIDWKSAERPEAGGWISNNQELTAGLLLAGMGGAAALGAGGGAAAAGTGAGSGAGEFAAWQAADMAGTGAAAGGGGAALGAAAPVAGGAAMGGGGGAAAGGAGLLGTLGQAAGALNSPLGAAALGAVAGAAGSGPQTSTSLQSLPDWLQPYAQPYAQRTMALADKPFEAYTGQGVAGLTPDQIQASQMIRNSVGQANPLGDASQAQMLSTINGQYLDPNSNPYLQSTFDQAAKRMTDAYNASSARSNAAFHDAGSFGSSGHQALVESNNRAFGDSLANLSNQIYGQNYQQERARQAQAMQYSPQFSGQMQSNTLRGADALNAAGAQARDVNQQGLNWDYSQFQRQQEYPYRQLDVMGGLFNPNLGRNTTQTQPGVSTTAGLLGGAAAGLGMYRQYNGLLGQPTTANQPQQNPYGFNPYTQDGSYYPGY